MCPEETKNKNKNFEFRGLTCLSPNGACTCLEQREWIYLKITCNSTEGNYGLVQIDLLALLDRFFFNNVLWYSVWHKLAKNKKPTE